MNNKTFIRMLAFAFKNDGAKVEELQHAYRINGVMDIMKNTLTVYDINNNKYHKFNKLADMQPVIEDIILNNKERIFKKTEAGNISYKEFKANLKKN